MSKRSKACDISPKVKKKVWERDNHCCIICGSPYAMPNAHYISRAQGGLGIETKTPAEIKSLLESWDKK